MPTAHGTFGGHAAVPPQNAVPPSAYGYPPTPHDWARIQGLIYEYYVVQNQPLHVVRESLRNKHGFRATERMIKARLAKWEYIKNAKREDWGYLAILHETRKRENKSTVFDIRGHRKTVKDLQRFIRNQNISPEKFLAESYDNIRNKGKQIPDYIRAYTPDPEDSLFSPSGETSLSELRSPSPLVADTPPPPPIVCAPTNKHSTNPDEVVCYRDPARSERGNFEHECVWKSYASESSPFSSLRTTPENMHSTAPSSHQGHESLSLYASERTRLELEAFSAQLLDPIPLRSRIGNRNMQCWAMLSRPASSEDAMDIIEHDTCSRCDQPSERHFPSLDLFDPRQGQRNILNDTTVDTLNVPRSTRDEGSWVWVSLCFLACMSLTKGDEEVARNVLDQAALKFEKLLRAQDPLLLTAAGLMITILHMHDQDDISVRILACAKAVVDQVLPAEDPVRVTISYLAMSADVSAKFLRAADFSSVQLRHVYHRLKTTYPARHPYVIAAHYNYAWMLKHGGEWDEAERHAREVYQDSVACFGKLHMQSITSLSVIAGCLAAQKGRELECIEVYRTIKNDATDILGIIHPYTLEAQRRLADTLEQIPGQKDAALKIHRTILFGRATMLGRNHKFTQGQRTDYETLLKELGKWEDRKGKPSKERKEIEDLFTRDPEEAWELVSKVDADICMSDVSASSVISGENTQEDEWCRLAIAKSLSRSATPSSGNEYEAY